MREARVKKENCVAHDLSRRVARHTEPSEGSGKHHRTGRPKRSLTLITLMNMPFWWRDVAGASLSAGFGSGGSDSHQSLSNYSSSDMYMRRCSMMLLGLSRGLP